MNIDFLSWPGKIFSDYLQNEGSYVLFIPLLEGLFLHFCPEVKHTCSTSNTYLNIPACLGHFLLWIFFLLKAGPTTIPLLFLVFSHSRSPTLKLTIYHKYIVFEGSHVVLQEKPLDLSLVAPERPTRIFSFLGPLKTHIFKISLASNVLPDLNLTIKCMLLKIIVRKGRLGIGHWSKLISFFVVGK